LANPGVELPPPQTSTRPVGSVIEPCPLEQSKGTGAEAPWDIKCILDIFCKGDREDQEVVKKLPRLTVHKREPKQVHFKKYTGGKWTDGGFTSGGSASGTTVAVNEDTKCSEAASTLYHEVTHTDQPSSMPGSQKEYDAYIKEEHWRIKKDLDPGGEKFRNQIPDPKDAARKIEVPNEDEIKKYVDKVYAYNPPTPLSGGPPPPRVLGLTADGKQVRLSDGTTRPPKEGDAYRLPDTGGKILETIDSSKWKCP
jgi:hypothetical protein